LNCIFKALSLLVSQVIEGKVER